MRPTHDTRPAGASPPPNSAEGRAITPGAHVLVRHDRHQPCTRHLLHSLSLFQHVGVVDRIDPRLGDHQVVVRFPTIVCLPFGEPWVDCFMASELVVLAAM